MKTRTLSIYGQSWPVEIERHVHQPPNAPRLVIVAFQPNATAAAMLRLCIDTIRGFTPEAHELWVVENGSPAGHKEWLRDERDINLIWNPTPPTPPGGIFGKLIHRNDWRFRGSYANAVALEMASQSIDADSQWMMTLHMDTMATRSGWLSELLRHANEQVRGVGVRLDESRVRTLHVLGMMFDFSLYRKLGLSFRPDMPRYDVGDGISMGLERAGYKLWACRNSLRQPEAIEALPPDSPYRAIHCDRSVDDQGNVIFLHLGRGIVKSTAGDAGGSSPDDWLRFGRDVVLRGSN